jgi:hypothetical protein
MLDAIAPGGRERRLVSAILVLGTVVLFFVAINLAASATSCWPSSWPGCSHSSSARSSRPSST